MSNGYQPPPRKRIALDNTKLRLSAPCPTAKGKYSTMAFGFSNNNPSVVVYTNDPADTVDNGMIKGAFDLPTFWAVMNFLTTAKDMEPGKILRVENKNFTFYGGKRSEEPKVLTELIVGKDKDGVVFISLISTNKERPRINFKLQPTLYHTWYRNGGEALSPAEVSCAYSESFAKNLLNIVNVLAVNEYVEPKKKETGQQGNSGYKKNYGQNNRGGSDSNDSGGDDFNDDFLY